jgi:hypothetical protein
MAINTYQCPVCDKELQIDSEVVVEELTRHVRNHHKERLVK